VVLRQEETIPVWSSLLKPEMGLSGFRDFRDFRTFAGRLNEQGSAFSPYSIIT
jgi:hypothetical protein